MGAMGSMVLSGIMKPDAPAAAPVIPDAPKPTLMPIPPDQKDKLTQQRTLQLQSGTVLGRNETNLSDKLG